MRIAGINMHSFGSTGKIMLNITDCARHEGMEVRTYSTHVFSFFYTKRPPAPFGHKYYGTWFENGLHFLIARITGFNGCFSYFGTRQLISDLKKYRPDIIHLHCLHQFCTHFPSLFRYIKKSGIPVVWTLHDCWAFTGKCPYFDIAKCDKWKTGCHHCPQYRDYPESCLDPTRLMYKLKKKWFTDISNMTVVAPSQWLAGLVRQSYLNEYPVRVIHNAIDLDIFKPTPSDFRKKHGLEGKYIVLGVADNWGYRKGLDVFVELSKRLDSRKYQIVLVGTSEYSEKQLPPDILAIRRTQNQAELARLYSAADVFANPTREEVFGMVNAEALACGTPVVTFDTGGSPEVSDKTCGSVVPCDDVGALCSEIIRVCETKPFLKDACLKRAQYFDKNSKFPEYINLYREIAVSLKP